MASLTLVSTLPAYGDLGKRNKKDKNSNATTEDPHGLNLAYPKAYLDAPSDRIPCLTHRSYLQAKADAIHQRFGITPASALMKQVRAIHRYQVSPAQFHAIRDAGYPILIVAGAMDILVAMERTIELYKGLASDHTQRKGFEKGGHALFQQYGIALARFTIDHQV